MQILKKGESGRKSTNIDVEKSVATCIHTTAHKSLDDGARFALTWHVDLSHLTPAQMMVAAAEYFIIKIRRDFNKIDKPKADWDGRTFDAAEYVTERTSPITKLQKTLSTFSDAELAAMGLVRASEK